MRPRPSTLHYRAAAGASIALAVLFCAWPSRTYAGCSHYVIAEIQKGRLAYWSEVFEHGGAFDLSNEAPARPKPCSGALCSGKPAAPIPTSAANSRSTTGEAVFPRTSIPPVSPPTGRCRAYAEQISRPLIEEPRLERPPR